MVIKYGIFLCAAASLFASADFSTTHQQIKEAGVELSASYANDLLGNPLGGAHRGFANAGSFGLDCLLDLEKIMSLKGVSLFSSFVIRHGNNLSQTKIGNQFPVAQLYGRETYGLCELYLQKEMWDGKLLVKAGRLAGGNDFLASPLYCQYVNNAFCGNPISIFFNTEFTAYPNATWAAYIQATPSPQFSMKFACYNNNENISKNKYHGVYFSFKSTQGVTFITECNYSPEIGELPGNYRAGAYYVTGKVSQFFGGSGNGNYGYYFLVDQMIYKKGILEITPFAAFLLATPDERNQFPFFLTTGIVYKGIIPKRPNDNLSLGAAYGSYSSDIQPKETYEAILELNYWVWINEWVVVAPDIQYVINPKGFGTIPNALVMGMQVIINI